MVVRYLYMMKSNCTLCSHIQLYWMILTQYWRNRIFFWLSSLLIVSPNTLTSKIVITFYYSHELDIYFISLFFPSESFIEKTNTKKNPKKNPTFIQWEKKKAESSTMLGERKYILSLSLWRHLFVSPTVWLFPFAPSR